MSQPRRATLRSHATRPAAHAAGTTDPRPADAPATKRATGTGPAAGTADAPAAKRATRPAAGTACAAVTERAVHVAHAGRVHENGPERTRAAAVSASVGPSP
ncbi:hypothetical protein DFJ69_2556 [Thermomonospora umbrina]|uniref:Uncharacterized protein n=1 Tax=Thermomonospora umbrina TaxID=111806 RepID=A0A3D9SRH7_9ACTN|nr:hypothetical protein DFJ69_2556 [Thermomonospora umbrina]